MLTFPFPWPTEIKFPGADSNQQVIAPVTNWLSPTVVTYAGDREIEERIVSEVASFGKQLGILTEALLELADDRPGAGLERLRQVANRVETVKARYHRALEDKAEEAFMALLRADPAAAERLVAALEQRVDDAGAGVDADPDGTPEEA
ncbi:hypothetical protein [Chthonobacter rhizosphaerae]|uniref:hypothetical protein n=1 Tax=Chthonobacter rhizosphaerae TaxID=2735553 RepID=UPI0015EF0532|nr:hypothetical protein [Chthonobacter rhizosphaerae]